MSLLLQVIQLLFLIIGTIGYIITCIVKYCKNKKAKITKMEINTLNETINEQCKEKGELMAFIESVKDNEKLKNFLQTLLTKKTYELKELETKKLEKENN